MKTKCAKCDERGYISDGGGASHSCECGWAIEQQKKAFEGVSMEELLEYGMMRIDQKKRDIGLQIKK